MNSTLDSPRLVPQIHLRLCLVIVFICLQRIHLLKHMMTLSIHFHIFVVIYGHKLNR